MCYQCNYENMRREANLDATDNRLRVMEVIGSNNYPLPAVDIYAILERSSRINRVTVYRILDLLVEHELVDRISSGGRSFYYGMAPNEHHEPHAHFYCKCCGRMDCLNPEILNIDADGLLKTFPGQIDKVEVRVDGVCRNCMRVPASGSK